MSEQINRAQPDAGHFSSPLGHLSDDQIAAAVAARLSGESVKFRLTDQRSWGHELEAYSPETLRLAALCFFEQRGSMDGFNAVYVQSRACGRWVNPGVCDFIWWTRWSDLVTLPIERWEKLWTAARNWRRVYGD